MEYTTSLNRKRKIVKELVEKQENWAFIDTKCKVDKKTAFKWNTLFQAFQYKEFKVLFHDDPSADLSKGIYKNISKSWVHRAIDKTLVLPCLDVIQWMTQNIDHESRTILNFEDKHVANYQSPILNLLYHFKESQVRVTIEWLQNKTESIYFLSILKGC